MLLTSREPLIIWGGCDIIKNKVMELFQTAKIGTIKKEVIKILDLNLNCETPIYIGESNYRHMFEKHKADFVKFGAYIDNIIESPDFVGINPRDKSIEYVKEFKIEDEFVKVAVRVSGRGKYFVKSMYSIPGYKVKNFLHIKRFKKLTNSQ